MVITITTTCSTTTTTSIATITNDDDVDDDNNNNNNIWLYSPVKLTLAYITIAFHSFLFLASAFQFRMPRLLIPLSR